MRDLLRLTRPVNLLIIAGTMVVVRHGVVGGLLGASGWSLGLGEAWFVVLVLSTVLIAAGGNVINDYFDTRIDRINKPDALIVGRTVPRRTAMMAHLVLSGAGLLLGWAVVVHTGLWRLAVIPPFAVGALWTYSTTFKRQLIIGNGLVATLTALVPLTVGLYEIPLAQRLHGAELMAAFQDEAAVRFYFRVLWYWVFAFTAFAFLATLVRELQKDMADVPGDRALGCRTIPIVWGMGAARVLVVVHTLVLVTALLLLRRAFLDDRLSYWYIAALILTLLIAAGLTWSARDRAGHVRAGLVMKVAMVLAVGYGLLVPLLLDMP
ncbi:MAG: geranylgeranylglycerol-phosphate geranylgeranyltransferase [Flavobacteriales bacterium]|nr:1,4-dihydroxy-2-naphthoate octaprenyltransferase [Flavobacteriales bacterium]MCC6576833.1 geranylgeranylglycerol-phosphate geranylgeranyltransferase [Flavobacteriales bacterium]NUQ14039.1 geranylgeranylglycerol-phosphate geranylgeranyltransferase [Flavobacteriales bacterium]